MSVVVVGSIAFDSVRTPFGTCEHVLGGAANYFSLSASFFTGVKLVGVIGDDFPETHLTYLKMRGVDTSGVKRQHGKTFHWQGSYYYDLNQAQTLKTELNVFSDFSPQLPGHYRAAETVFLANIDPVLQLQVLDQVQNPKIVALDTMNYWIEGKNVELKKAISRVNILLINESEIRQLAKEHNIVRAGRVIQALGPKIIVIKRGEYGSLLFHEESMFMLPAYPLEDLFDPTGAGDTFAGGFLGWLDKKAEISFDSLKEAMLLGTVMASFVIEKFSFDRMRTLEHRDIKNRYAQLQEISHAPSKPIEISL
jgi:sugar/nucleoside kinase (ribokinase family)